MTGYAASSGQQLRASHFRDCPHGHANVRVQTYITHSGETFASTLNKTYTMLDHHHNHKALML